MTRINLVRPFELTNKHLLAEYRELPRVFRLVSNRIALGKSFDDIPEKYTMGPGHVKFFYNKLLFLAKRHETIRLEMSNRGFHVGYTQGFELFKYPKELMNDWIPSDEDIDISKQRLSDRMKN
jgi:deoxyribonuclease (pyrimidine dimer)